MRNMQISFIYELIQHVFSLKPQLGSLDLLLPNQVVGHLKFRKGWGMKEFHKAVLLSLES